jgi:phage/plasmid-associated DNA primase
MKASLYAIPPSAKRGLWNGRLNGTVSALCLTAYPFQGLFVLWGRRRNGKGVLLRLLAHMLGSGFTAKLPPNELTVSKYDEDKAKRSLNNWSCQQMRNPTFPMTSVQGTCLFCSFPSRLQRSAKQDPNLETALQLEAPGILSQRIALLKRDYRHHQLLPMQLPNCWRRTI